MIFAPTQLDKAIDLWIKNTSYATGLGFAAWAAWLISLSVALAVLFAIYYFYFIKKDTGFAIKIAASSLVTVVVTEILKRTLLRPRPDASDLFSFPSRHAAFAFLLATLLILQNPRDKKRYLLLFWAVAVMFSRVWLEQHYVTDIVAGAIVGIVVALVFFGNKKKRRK